MDESLEVGRRRLWAETKMTPWAGLVPDSGQGLAASRIAYRCGEGSQGKDGLTIPPSWLGQGMELSLMDPENYRGRVTKEDPLSDRKRRAWVPNQGRWR